MAEKENRGGGTVSLPSEEEEEEGREGPPKRRGVGRGGSLKRTRTLTLLRPAS